MGWVSVATLIATACYVFYRFPPSTWPTEYPLHHPEPISDKTPRSPPKSDAKATNEAKSPATAIPEIKPASEDHNRGQEEEETPQTTPKASAANAPGRVLDIPVLDLDNNADNKPIQNGSTVSYSVFRNESALHTPGKVARNNMMPPPSPPSQPQPQSQPAVKANSSSLMPPPPLPRHRAMGQQQQPQPPQSSQRLSPGRLPPRPANSNSLLRPPALSAAASQRGPPAGSSLAPPAQASLSLKPPKASSASSKRAILEPGYSPLDWAAKTSNPKENLRGANLPPALIRVTPSMLKAQNGRKGNDAWTSYQGKVYNISPYVPFHPGGKGELLRGAGKDSARLFAEVHPWVNWEGILGECCVGILVSENEAGVQPNALDAMD